MDQMVLNRLEICVFFSERFFEFFVYMFVFLRFSWCFVMYSGMVFFCDNASQQQCLSRRFYACADKKGRSSGEILPGTVVFLYNLEDKTLLGPFTVLEEGGTMLDAGAWAMDIDEHSASENVQVTWKELHQVDNALEKLPFLNDPEKCSLTSLQTQRILEVLKESKPYLQVKKEKETT
ncbi:MAG: hypothetical protein FWG55_01105 [Candidatus Bathyarchaeota archaeon]|nr:hypothetical protein [Candidatus Termiticorpusculum sp.]